MAKQNDYFLNQMFNPTFTPGDFQEVGLTSNNTSIEDINTYKKLDAVQNNELFQTNGTFDENKFKNFYDNTLQQFNLFSMQGAGERLATSYSVFRDDIFAKSSNNRIEGPETFISKIANPNAQSIGFVSKNILEKPRQSYREVAESHLLWDGATNSWQESPNDSPLDNFINPKVLAQWETDVDINGKTQGQVGFDANNIKYHKGDKKVNPITGEYYYESLNGRSIYGREVLSGWDTLTVDGSKFNKYDFFDSDDIKKSPGGSLLKAAVKIAPALIPAVSPWYIMGRVLLSSADLFGKVGKMLPGVGSENPTLSWLEGLNKSFTMSTSDYGQQHQWKMENMLSLAADVFTQLAEQRWIFKYGSTLINGKIGASTKAQQKFLEAAEAEQKAKFMNEIGSIEDAAIRLPAMATYEAQAALNAKLAAGQKFSEQLSKLYMTGITVSDSFAEAKNSGLSDLEATLFTLAYAAGEYGILSTNLGEHILPELRANKNRWKNIAKTLHDIKETSETPQKWYKGIWDFAKQTVKGDLNDSRIAKALRANNTGKALALSVASNALGEGLEEVSEEVLLDMAKGAYNALANLHLTSTGATIDIEGGNLEDIFNRYALNFVGGLMGGAIAVGLPGFQQGVKNMLGTNMDRKQAYQELVAIIRNGQKDDFLKTVSKLELNDSQLSARNYQIKDGVFNYQQGTQDDNLNLSAHKVLTDMVNTIEKVLNVNGAALDDDTILKHLTTDARQLLQFHRVLGSDTEGSAVLASYVQDYNTLATQIASLAIELDALKNPQVDQKEKREKISEENAKSITEKTNKLNKLLQQRDMYLNGEMTKYALPAAIFEMSDYISAPYLATNFKDYVKSVEHKVVSELTDDRVAELKDEWESIREGNLADNIRTAHSYFQIIQQKFSQHLTQFADILKQSNNELYNLGNVFQRAETGNWGTQKVTEGILNTGITEDIQRNTQNYERDVNLTEETNINKTALAMVSLLKEISDSNPDKQFSRLDQKLALAVINPENIENPEAVQSLLNELYPGITLENLKDAQKRALNEAVVELFYNYQNEIVEVIKDLPYMSQNIKDFLKNNIINLIETGGLQSTVEDLINQGVIEYLDEDNETEFWDTYNKAIDSVITTPIEQLADSFQLSIGDNQMKISELVRTLSMEMRKSANTGNIQDFGYSEAIANQIKNALKVLDLLSAHVLASRNDGANEGNLFGYNVVVNTLIPESKLAEIDKNTANIIMNDLAKLKDKLLYYQSIFDINSGAKLQEQDKIQVRLQVAFLNRAKTLVGAFPEDWNVQSNDTLVLDNLKSILEKAQTFAEISKNESADKYTLSKDKALTLEKEYVQVQDAIYDLFEANSDKIAEGKLSEVLKLFKLLPSTTEKSNTYDGTLVDPQLESLDDRSFLWMLVAAAGVRTSSFYSEYVNSLDERFAPIPGQEIAIKMAYSFLLNKPLFKQFAKAYNDKILQELPEVDGSLINDLYGKSAYKDGKLDNAYAIQFFNTFLTEGIPGAGKSTGFYSVLVKMLNTYHSEFLNEVWIVHTDPAKAQELGKNIGLDTKKCKFFDKNSYLKKICPTYVEPTLHNGVIQIDLNTLEEDQETGIHYYKNSDIATDCGIPSLLIIDESTRFSQQDLLLSDKFQEQSSISALATGDYDQIGAIGETRVSGDGNSSILLTIDTAQDNFVHSPKLGTSMRTENKLKDINIALVRQRKLEIINSLREGSPGTQLNLQYYQNLDPSAKYYGLYGDKIVEADESDEDISLMLNSIKEGEKLYFIYQTKDTPLYKKFKALKEQEAYKNKIELVDSGSVQGEEGQYYVVELAPLDIQKEEAGKNAGNHQQFMNTFYTAISRSTQGTLIINNQNVQSVAYSVQVKEFTNNPLGKEAIKQFSQKRKDTINSFLTGSEEKTQVKGQIPKPKTEDKLPEEEGTTTNNDESPDEETTNNLNNKKVPTITNTINETYNMLTHSMPVQETGFETVDDKLKPGIGYDKRIDGLNGLTKLSKIKVGNNFILADPRNANTNLGLNTTNELNNQEVALATLNKLRQIGTYETDIKEIKRQVKDTLGIQVDFGVNFQYMTVTRGDQSTFNAKNSSGFGRFFRGVKEQIVGLFTGSSAQSKEATQESYFAMNIYVIDNNMRKSVLTIPISIFTSPLTMMNTNGMEPLRRLFPPKSAGKLGIRMQKMKDLLSDDTTFEQAISSFSEEDKNLARINRPKLLKHFRIYTYNSFTDAVIFFPDDWTFAGQAQRITGPNITTHEKGGEYFEERFYWPGEYINLDDLDTSIHSISSDVFYSDGDIKLNGKTVIKSGYPFVLISDFYDLSNMSRQEILDKFMQEEINDNPSGKISAIMVCTPAVSFEEYFENAAAVAIKDKDHVDPNIGNKMTDIRIAESITKEGSTFSAIMQQEIDKENSNTERGTLESRADNELFKYRLNNWKAFVSLMNALKNDFEGKTSEEYLAALEKRGIEDKYWNILIESNPALSKNWKTLSLKRFISQQIIDFVLRTKPKNAGGDLNYSKSNGKLTLTSEIAEKINAVKEDSKDILPYGIITNVKGMGIENTVSSSNGKNISAKFAPVSLTNDGYQILIKGKNRPLRINGKIDTTVHLMDVSNIMDQIEKIMYPIDDDSKQSKKNQVGWYNHDTWVNTQAEEVTKKEAPDVIKQLFSNPKLLDAFYTLYWNEVKDIDDVNNLFNILNEKGYIWHNYTGKLTLIQDKPNYKNIVGNIVQSTTTNEYGLVNQDSSISPITKELLQFEIDNGRLERETLNEDLLAILNTSEEEEPLQEVDLNTITPEQIRAMAQEVLREDSPFNSMGYTEDQLVESIEAFIENPEEISYIFFLDGFNTDSKEFWNKFPNLKLLVPYYHC